MSRQSKERGSIVMVAMLVLVALLSIGMLSTLAVKSGITSGAHDRFRAIALYAAESGAAVAMDQLRKTVDKTTYWSAYVSPNNDPLIVPADVPGNGALPGTAANVFSPDLKAWYEVVVVNNEDDPGFATGNDLDQRVILRSTGHGPGGTVAQIEWDIRVDGPIGLAACSEYGQKNMGSTNSGTGCGAVDVSGAGLTVFTP